jgi:undecaprenyl-diphosphatase
MAKRARPRIIALAVASCVELGSSAATADPRPRSGPLSSSGRDPPRQDEGQHFTIDPVTDGLLVAGGAGLAGLLSLVLSTGEIRANPPGDPGRLLSFDRGAVTQTIDTNAALYSDVALYASVGFAALDTILSGFRDGWDSLLVDAVMYAETISLTEMITDLTKIAVRRPRPIDYVNCPEGSVSVGCSSDTDLQLSFFSGHAATVASIGATATYLAFLRSPRSPRPWITLGVATAMTTFVSYERVRSGNHFPTDVIAGAMVGTAVGILVPHLHRHRDEAPPVWIGVAPSAGGGSITMGAVF